MHKSGADPEMNIAFWSFISSLFWSVLDIFIILPGLHRNFTVTPFYFILSFNLYILYCTKLSIILLKYFLRSDFLELPNKAKNLL